MDQEIQKEINKLSNLKNYKSLGEDEILRIATLNLKIKKFKANKVFYYEIEDEKTGKMVQADSSKKEEALALGRFKSYISNYTIESDADLDTLSSLVFNEILEYRLQSEINRCHAEGRNLPTQLTKQLTEIQDQKTKLKLKLGIDKSEIKDSELTVLQKLEKRFDKWVIENRHECTLDIPLICEKCNHEAKYSFLLRKRVKDFDAIKHPWFAGRWFFNLPVLKFVKEGILTKTQAAEILSKASENIETQSAFSEEYCTDYINYCLDHWAEITSFLDKK